MKENTTVNQLANLISRVFIRSQEINEDDIVFFLSLTVTVGMHIIQNISFEKTKIPDIVSKKK